MKNNFMRVSTLSQPQVAGTRIERESGCKPDLGLCLSATVYLTELLLREARQAGDRGAHTRRPSPL